jgi:hypothetical protein
MKKKNLQFERNANCARQLMFMILISFAFTLLFSFDTQAQRVGDVMPYYDATSSKFYIYYLKDIWNDATNQRHPWSALTTTDFNVYTDIGEKLSCSTDPCKQDFAIGTGSVIKEGSVYYAFYTGHNPNFPSQSCATTKEGVMLATSTSPNSNFTKSTSFTTIYAPSGYDVLDNFRDPYVYKEGTTFYMIVSARTSVNGSWKGVIAKYTSTNLTSWNYAGILYDGGSTNFFMMECSEIFKMGSTYYLTFSDTDTKKVFYRKSSSINGPWSNPAGVGTLDGVGYAARTASNGTDTYIWGWQVSGTTWAGDLITKQLLQDSNGDLIVTSISSNIAVTGASVTPSTATISVGATQQLTATIAPSNATNTTLYWSSNNTSIASVNSSGLVTGVAAGSATVTVTTQDGSKTSTSAVTVNANTTPVTGVTISPTTASLSVGATQQLTAAIAPTNATDKTVSWSSNNTSIATVNSSGLVTAVAVGSATITVTTQNGNKTATCAVTAIASNPPGIVPGTYKIIARHSGKAMDADAGGSTNGAWVQQWDYLGGSNQKWNITAAPEAGYFILTSVSGGKVVDSDGTANGAKIQVWSYLNGENQKWQIAAAGGGYFKILSKTNGRAIGVTSSSLSNGGQLQLQDFTGGTQQQWSFTMLTGGREATDAFSMQGEVDINNEVVVYPVPVNDIFTVDLTSFKGEQNIKVEITDISGRKIEHLDAKPEKHSFSTKALGMTSGIYLIKAQSIQNFSTAKIMIE